MLPDRVSKPRTPDLRVRCPTDCATRPGPPSVFEPLKLKFYCIQNFYSRCTVLHCTTLYFPVSINPVNLENIVIFSYQLTKSAEPDQTAECLEV